MSFGHIAKKNEFVLNDVITFINHGSFGTAPKYVYETRMKLLQLQESDPNQWFAVHSLEYHNQSISAVAKFVGAEEANLVFAENATTGINHVTKSLNLATDDVILVTSFTYKAIQYTCQAVADKTDAKVLYLNMEEPIRSEEDIVNRLETCLQNNSAIKLAVLDYISSPTATKFPIIDFIKVCKKHNVLIIVDGAHAPGQVPLNLEELGRFGMDFFTGNLHKWAYCCRGCAILWVNPIHHNKIRPLVTSFQYFYETDDFRSRFVRNGTNDRTTFYCAKAAIEFIEQHGGLEAIVKYNASLLDDAVEYLVKLWGTKKYPIPKEMEAPCMRLIRLPDLKKFPPVSGFTNAPFEEVKNLTRILHDRFNLAVFVTYIYNELWIRITANIYNSIEDYHKLGSAICQLVEEDV